MRPSHILLLVAGAATLAVLWVPSAVRAEGCLRYGSTTTLAGHFAADVAPSGNASGRKADILTLNAPSCIAADVVSPGIPHVASVQVLCRDAEWVDGAPASITGRLVGAHTGNGHPPILLVCRP